MGVDVGIPVPPPCGALVGAALRVFVFVEDDELVLKYTDSMVLILPQTYATAETSGQENVWQ